jgi:3-dehydroquinate synthase
MDITVELGERTYPILIRHNILPKIGEILEGLNLNPKIAVITNPTVGKLYSKIVLEALEKASFDPCLIQIPDGETAKSLEVCHLVYKELLNHKLERDSALIALGGGVVGDLAGFVAATYLRGVPYIQVPTTLLAQVDSSVGGKVAVNLPEGKNLIGAFYQPKMVIIDTDVLKTLPKREFNSGIAEVVKYGVIKDESLFKYLSNHESLIKTLDHDVLSYIVKTSCKIKAEIVSRDERDAKGIRMILNYGHTIGHAIEGASNYERYLHGEAVSIGMVCASQIAIKKGYLLKEDLDRQKQLLSSFNLPIRFSSDISIDKIMEVMEYDKKSNIGKIRFILPKRIGCVIIENNVSRDLVHEVLNGQRE